jgi:hypothetical protein
MQLKAVCFSVMTSVMAAVAWLGRKKEDLLLLLPPKRRRS